jgi:hypothetical protein
MRKRLHEETYMCATSDLDLFPPTAAHLEYVASTLLISRVRGRVRRFIRDGRPGVSSGAHSNHVFQEGSPTTSLAGGLSDKRTCIYHANNSFPS